VHELIASPFLDDHLLLRRRSTRGIKIGLGVSGNSSWLPATDVGRECCCPRTSA
jgi:hypothetical protein